MDHPTARAMGALYIALTNAMPSAAAELAHDTVRDLIDNPRSSSEERWLYQTIIGAVNSDEAEARPCLEVIEGGAA
jgi:2-iminoacetate synthase ThiH